MQAWEKLPADAAIQTGIDAFIAAYETDEPTRMLSAFVKRKWEQATSTPPISARVGIQHFSLGPRFGGDERLTARH